MSLSKEYEDYIDGFGLRSALDKELQFEDDYYDHLVAILNEARHPTGGYTGAFSFTGGGGAAQETLRRIAEHLSSNAAIVGLPSVPLYCGLIPAGDFDVTTEEYDSGSVVRFDIALWFFLRLAAQQITEVLGSFSGEKEWGADIDHPTEVGALLRDRLNNYISLGHPLRYKTQLRVMHGPREKFRRDLNLASVAWFVGHEYGHAILGGNEWKPTRGSIAERALIWDIQGVRKGSDLEQIWTEQAEILSQGIEYQADACGCALIQIPSFRSHPLALAIAPMLGLTLQAFEFHAGRLARKRKGQAWTHATPELRAYLSTEIMARTSSRVAAVRTTADNIREWLWDSLQIDRLFAEDTPEGLEPL
jgi:hypothetical protein